VKRWIVAGLAVVLVLTVAPAAMAGNGKAHGKSKFMAKGPVTAVDPDGGTLALTVKTGTKTVRPYRGLDLPVLVAAGAKLRQATPDGCVNITLADIAPGAKVMVKGRIDRSDPAAPVFVATWVLVKVPAEAPAPVEEETPPAPAPEE
jgi:hypothetical protein